VPFAIDIQRLKYRLEGTPASSLPQVLAVLVEIKRKSRIDASVEAEMRRKLEVFPRKRNVSLRTALVYEGELDESVARGGFFDFMIPIETLLA